MNKKLFLIPVLMILLISFVSADDLTTDLVYYHTFDNTLADATGNGYTYSNNGASYTASGFINGGYDFEASESDYMTSTYTIPTDSDFTYNIWIKYENLSSESYFFTELDDDTDNRDGALIGLGNANKIRSVLYNDGDGTTGYFQNVGDDLSTTNFMMLTAVYDETGQNYSYYQNGVRITTDTTADRDSADNSILIGSYSHELATKFLDAVIDEDALWIRPLGTDEIAELYNSGSGLSYADYDVAATTYFDVTNTNSINNFTIYINSTSYSTTNGTIHTDIPENGELFNLIVESDEGYYFNVTRTNYNISDDLSVTFTQYPYVNVTAAYNRSVPVTGYAVYDYATSSLLGIDDDSDGFVYLNLNESKTIQLSKSLWFHRVITHDFTDSNDLDAFMYQAIINITINESYSGNPISNWSLYNGSTLLINTTSDSGVFYPVLGNFSNLILKSNSGSFSNRNLDSFTAGQLQDRTINYEILPTELNITAYSLVSDSAISGFNVSISSLNNSHSLSYETSGSSIVFGVIDGDTYNITIDAAGYSLFNSSILKLISGNSNHTFNLYTTNSINFFFRYESNESLINQEVEVEIIGDTYSYNYTTSNGTLYVDLISPDDYTIRTNSENYSENFYYLALSSRSYNEVTIYLATNSTPQITGIVIDEVNNFLEGAIIRVLKYYAGDNTYKLVGMGKTNFEGETLLSVEKGSEYYKFMIYYPDNTLAKTTNPMYIFDDTEILTFQIILNNPVAENFFNSYFTDYSLGYNNATNNFRFTFSDTDALSSQYCLKTYNLNALGETLLNTSCLTSSSGTILLGITPVNGSSYIAKAFAYYSGTPYFLTSKSVTFEQSNNNPLWLFLVAFLTIAFAMSAIWNLQAFLLLTPLPLFVTSIIGLIPISPFIMGAMYIGFIIIAFTINK